MFVAPDPGLVRLRVSLRAVLGIGLAVALAELAGFSLTASITAGLAALLALFTVGDPTVRRQAVTTALLPAAGFPVLALATLLHDLPSCATPPGSSSSSPGSTPAAGDRADTPSASSPSCSSS